MTCRQPNRRLREMLREADWSGAQLASAVNTLGEEAGVPLHYDRTAVSHWLGGTRPRPPVPALIAEALSRRIGRKVDTCQAGFALAAEGPLGLDSAGKHQDVAQLFTLLADGPGAADRARRQVPPFSTAALAVRGYLEAVSMAADSASCRRTPTVQRFHVDAARCLAAVFAAGDAAFGGGHGRSALARYLAGDLGLRLRHSASPAVRQGLLTVTADLAYLCGFMCFDEEQHGRAQQYYAAALRLATQNEDPVGYSVALRAMSVQASTLGHAREAVHLAETAASTRLHSPMRQAFVYGQLAVALAAEHDRYRCLRALTAAERALDQATDRADTLVGRCHQASILYQQAEVRVLLGDRDGGIDALERSLRVRPSDEARSRAVIRARLAKLRLDRGDLDRAIADWNLFLDDYPSLCSGRVRSAMTLLRARIRPYTLNRSARKLADRAAQLSACGPRR